MMNSIKDWIDTQNITKTVIKLKEFSETFQITATFVKLQELSRQFRRVAHYSLDNCCIHSRFSLPFMPLLSDPSNPPRQVFSLDDSSHFRRIVDALSKQKYSSRYF